MTAADPPAPWLLPIGIPAGICSGFEGFDDGSGFVGLGEERVNLAANLYSIWRAAGAAPTREELLAWAADHGTPARPEDIGLLLDDGLLLEAGPDSEARIAGLALQLTGECIGNGSERQPTFAVLGRDGAQLKVDVISYEVLLRSDGATAIADICRELEATCAPLPDGACLRAIATGLPQLVRLGIVRVDLPRRA